MIYYRFVAAVDASKTNYDNGYKIRTARFYHINTVQY